MMLQHLNTHTHFAHTHTYLLSGQVNGKANYHVMRKAYEHILGVDGRHFTAYNMTSGSFGGARTRDMFMVQSLDGKLQIFEQSANAFTRQLVDCLLPGPIAYLPRLDAFVSATYSCQAECYRYQVGWGDVITGHTKQ